MKAHVSDDCVGCGGCISGYDGSGGCPHGAITLDGSKAMVDAERCTGCGKCAQLCGLGAIQQVWTLQIRDQEYKGD